MKKQDIANKLTDEDKHKFVRYMQSIELRAIQNACFDLWENYTGHPVDRSCGKCRVKTIRLIQETIKLF